MEIKDLFKELLAGLLILPMLISNFSYGQENCNDEYFNNGSLPYSGQLINYGSVSSIPLNTAFEVGSGYRDYNRLVCVYWPSFSSTQYRNGYSYIASFQSNLKRYDVFENDGYTQVGVYISYCAYFPACSTSSLYLNGNINLSSFSSVYFYYKVILLDEINNYNNLCSSYYNNGYAVGYSSGLDFGYNSGFSVGYSSGYSAGYSSGSNSCPACEECPSCPSCPSCDDPYTSQECQTEYNLIPISSVDSNYCENNNLCSSCPECQECPSFTGDLIPGVSNIFINDIFHPGAFNIIMNIPSEIDWDYSYTNSGSNFNIDVVGYNQDSDYIDGLIEINNYKPNSDDFSKVFLLFKEYSGLLLALLFVILTFYFVKKLF